MRAGIVLGLGLLFLVGLYLGHLERKAPVDTEASYAWRRFLDGS